MSDYRLGSHAGPDGPAPVVIVGDNVYRVPDAVSTRAMLEDWDRWRERLDGYAEGGDLQLLGAVDEVRLGPPVPDAPNMYMAGANYADHAVTCPGCAGRRSSGSMRAVRIGAGRELGDPLQTSVPDPPAAGPAQRDI